MSELLAGVIGAIIGALAGAGIMSALSVRAYNKGYEDALFERKMGHIPKSQQ
jgi:uncharacterized membrane protein